MPACGWNTPSGKTRDFYPRDPIKRPPKKNTGSINGQGINNHGIEIVLFEQLVMIFLFIQSVVLLITLRPYTSNYANV